jgi:arylsulfatase A-like enzyme
MYADHLHRRRQWHERTLEGTFNQLTAYNGILTLPEVVQMPHYEDWGSHYTYPTILEAAGIKAPTTVEGIAQKPIERVSMGYTFDKANADAPSKRDTQYFEMVGNRAIYHDG